MPPIPARLTRAACFLAALAPATWAAAARAVETPPNGPLYNLLGAPPDWSVSGTVRIRGEGIDNNFRPAPVDSSTGMLSTRTTLFAEYHPGPFRAGLELFDSRAYFEGPRSSVSTSEVNTFELGQAYIGWRDKTTFILPGTTDITAGRFTMDDGGRRLLARNQFRNTINSFTGLRAEWTDAAKDRLLLFWTMPQTRLPNDPEKIRENAADYDLETPDYQFFGGSITKSGILGGTAQIYSYWLQESDTPDLATRNRHLVTPGARLFRAPKPGHLDWDFDGAVQTGHQRATNSPADRRDLATDAYFFHLESGYTFKTPWEPRVFLQYDQASGNGRDRNRFDRFDTLFGARSFDFGPTSLYGALQRTNVRTFAARVLVNPTKRLDVQAAVRPIWLDSATDALATTSVRDRNGRSGTFAGTQLEWRARYWLKPKTIRLDGGMAFLIKDRFLTEAPNAPPADDTTYAWLDVIFAF